jgi:cell division protein FtsA
VSFVVVGLDIGSSFVRAVIAEIVENNTLNNTLKIIGCGKAQSSNIMRMGTIVNIESTVKALSKALSDAEILAGVEASACTVSIGGTQIEGIHQKGIVPVPKKGNSLGEISRADMDRAIETAKAVLIPMDRQILHVVPQSYKVDDVEGVKDPINMLGVRLEVGVYIITTAATPMENIRSCVARAGYSLDTVMLKTLAATEASVTPEEKELGSIVIDFGGGTTDVIVLYEGAPVCSASIPVGGIFVTNDIAVVKGISWDVAEKIKIKSGCCWQDMIEDYEDVLIPSVGGRAPEIITKSELCQIIQMRMEQILRMARKEIMNKSSVAELSGNIVLTGGGASLTGIVELTQHIFATSAVRLGNPVGLANDSLEECRTPEWSTAIGLAKSAMPGGAVKKSSRLDTAAGGSYNEALAGRFVKPLGERLKGYLREFF